MRKSFKKRLSYVLGGFLSTIALTSMISCASMSDSNFDIGILDPDYNNPFVGVWLFTTAKTDTTEVHMQFNERGMGVEIETIGDSIIDIKDFRYSFNADNITIESSNSLFIGRYTYGFEGKDNDTMIFDSYYKFVKWRYYENLPEIE